MSEKIKIPYPVIVEGKYDKIKLSSVLDAVIIQTDGFRVYKDKEKQSLIRRLASSDKIIIATDSDRAGFQLRNFIRSITGDVNIINIYIPQLSGKEKRKAAPSKENLLGVEGIQADVLRRLFSAVIDETPRKSDKEITRADFFADGISGGENSAAKRRALLKSLDLPEYISSNSLLQIINLLIGYDEYKKRISEIN